MLEKAKISLRNIRQEAMNVLKKSSQDENIPEDEVKILQDNIQKLTDKFNLNINEVSKTKEEDIMKI